MPGLPGRTLPTGPLPEAGPGEPGASLFTWALWAATLGGAVALVAAYGPDVPVGDDYALVPALTRDQRVDAAWLWGQHNEHRIPLLKVVLLAAYRLSGGDFRAGMYVTLATLGTLAAGQILLAHALRGGTRYADAFFPIILLNPGHHEYFLWSFQVGFALSAAMVASLLILVVVRPGWPGPGRSAIVAAILTILPLCTASGLAAVPAPVAWLWCAARAHWRSGEPRGRSRALAILALTAPALSLMVLYFRGYRRPPDQTAPTGPAEALRTALQFLSFAFGPATKALGPASWPVVPALILVAAAALVAAWSRRAAERPRIAGLLACFVGNLALALGIGWGRSGGGEFAGLQDRYVTLAVPALLGVAFACDLYGGPALRRLVPMVLLALALGTLWPNTQLALVHGRRSAAGVAAFKRDLRAGVPLHRLLKRYTPFLHPQPDALAGYFRQLRRAGIGPFRTLQDDPPFRAAPVPPTPSKVSLLRWEGRTARVTGVDPWITFALPRPRYVAGVRLRYAHSNPAGLSARFKLSWKRADQADFPATQEFAIWGLDSGTGREVTVWVCDTIDAIRIQPDNRPCEFRIDALDLLVP